MPHPNVVAFLTYLCIAEEFERIRRYLPRRPRLSSERVATRRTLGSGVQADSSGKSTSADKT
jgi:hypothetical protein